MGIAQDIRKSTLAKEIGLTEAQKAAEAKRQVPLTPEAPLKKVPGVLHIEAEAYAKTSEVRLLDCYTGGKQVSFSKNVNASFVEYTVNVRASGAYELTMRAAAANVDQKFDVHSGANKLATVNVPNTNGLTGILLTQPPPTCTCLATMVSAPFTGLRPPKAGIDQAFQAWGDVASYCLLSTPRRACAAA